MMDLKTILDEWKGDCEISELHLDETSREVPILHSKYCLLYTSPSPRDGLLSRMPSSA